MPTIFNSPVTRTRRRRALKCFSLPSFWPIQSYHFCIRKFIAVSSVSICLINKYKILALVGYFARRSGFARGWKYFGGVSKRQRNPLYYHLYNREFRLQIVTVMLILFTRPCPTSLRSAFSQSLNIPYLLLHISRTRFLFSVGRPPPRPSPLPLLLHTQIHMHLFYFSRISVYFDICTCRLSQIRS